MPWQSPTITVKWGNYFAPDPAEQKQIVELVAAALTAKAITKRMAVEKLAPIFGTENIEAALEALEEEADADAQRQLESTTAELEAAHALTNAQAPGADSAGAAGRGNQAKTPGGRGGGSTPPPAKA